MADEMLFRELEQVLRRGIGVGHAARGIEHEHRGRQQFEPGEGVAGIVAGARKGKSFETAIMAGAVPAA